MCPAQCGPGFAAAIVGLCKAAHAKSNDHRIGKARLKFCRCAVWRAKNRLVTLARLKPSTSSLVCERLAMNSLRALVKECGRCTCRGVEGPGVGCTGQRRDAMGSGKRGLVCILLVQTADSRQQ